MKIEAGKFYRTRDGRKVGPMRCSHLRAWEVAKSDHCDPDWHFNGKARANTDVDLIAEWSDTPHIDLTALTAPFGLLDEVYGPGTAQALRDHGGPYEWFDGWTWRPAPGCAAMPSMVHRVAPAPKVETVTNREMYLTARGCVASNAALEKTQPITITYTIIDGKIDPLSYRMEARK